MESPWCPRYELPVVLSSYVLRHLVTNHFGNRSVPRETKTKKGATLLPFLRYRTDSIRHPHHRKLPVWLALRRGRNSMDADICPIVFFVLIQA